MLKWQLMRSWIRPQAPTQRVPPHREKQMYDLEGLFVRGWWWQSASYLYMKIGGWDEIICQRARKHYHQRSPYMVRADKADKREQEQGVLPQVRWEESTRVAGMITKQILLLDGKKRLQAKTPISRRWTLSPNKAQQSWKGFHKGLYYLLFTWSRTLVLCWFLTMLLLFKLL